VLAVLLLNAGQVVSADRLVDAIWGETPPETAANMLQGYISHLRKTIEPGRERGEYEVIASQPPGYVLHIEPQQVDAGRFERLATEGCRLLEGGDARGAADRLRAALSLWRGPALADLTYEPYARGEIERILARRPIRYEIPDGGIGERDLAATVTVERDPDDELDHAIDENERGLKDTVRVNPNEIVEIAVCFTTYSGRYMYHCHILEHEDRDMMRPFVTMPPELMPFMA
jgi:hypothetical protein